MPDVTDAGAQSTTAPAPEPPLSTYGSFYYAAYESGAYERNEKWLGLFRSFADHIVEDLAPATAFDAGCAIGLLVEALRERGVEAHGRDISEFAIGQADERVAEYVEQGSIADPLPGTYDLVTCIEVMEHLPADDAEQAIASLCAATDTILFSSAPDDFAEPSHINLRPTEAWSVAFAKHGFVRDVDYDARWLSPWAVLYRRGDTTPDALVRSYDRALYRALREIGELRGTAVELENQLDVVYADTTPELRAARDEADELRRTLAETRDSLEALHQLHDDLQSRHRTLAEERASQEAATEAARSELLALRDRLIGQEQELGHVRGQVAQLDAQLAAYGDLPERYEQVVHSTTWRLAWKLMGPYRKVRTRLRPPG